MNTFRDHATELLELELIPTPLSDKGAFLPKWTTLDKEEILKIENWRNVTGLGLLTGERTGVICLDVDILEDDPNLEKRQIRKELEKILPPIYSGVIGNPKKIPARFFKYNGERSRKFNAINIELLSTGNQKAIPPSIHPSGKKYEWIGEPLTDIDIDDLPDLPDFVINFIEEKNEEEKFKQNKIPLENKLSPGKNRSNHGSHDHLSKYALSLFYRGYNFDDITDHVLEEDLRINKSADVVYFLCPSRRWYQYENPRINAIKFTAEIFQRNIDKRYSKSDFFKESLANGFTWRNPGDANARPRRQYIDLYNFMKIKLDTWYVPEIKSFYVWDGKKYKIKSDDFIRKYAQDHFKNPSCIAISEKNTFLDYAKNAQQCSNNDFIMSDRRAINLENGVYDITQKKLVPHHKKYRFPYVIPHNYIEAEGDCEVWDTLLDRITLGRKHFQIAIEEFIGYALSGCSYNVFNKILILDGGGSNGKSTLIRIIQELIGEENTSSVGLTAISNERFAGFNLVNKLVNFCSEEPKEAFANTGPIKKLTGGDPIMVEEKHKGAFQYANIAKLIISYNKMPFFPDGSSGMKRRIILIPCEQNFDKHPKLKLVRPEEAILKKEANALLTRCIRRFEEVIAKGSFMSVDEGSERLTKMITDSDPVLGFIEDELKIIGGKDNYATLSDLFNRFKESQGGSTQWSKRGFLNRLWEELSKDASVTRGQKKLQMTTSKVIFGIQFQSNV
jgi:P4 family phage/plasmid primase-like protien